MKIDGLLTEVQERGRLADAQTPPIDVVLALVEQLGRSLAHYHAFPDSAITPLVESAAEE